jgi:hypothetical protein
MMITGGSADERENVSRFLIQYASQHAGADELAL